MAIYIALLRKDPGSDFGVDFPDFPGCVTAGSTLEEVLAMAQEALAGHIEAMLEVGEPVPPPSVFEEVLSNPENTGAIPFLVPVPDRCAKTVCVNVTLSEADLEAINAIARKRGKSRSALLTEAAHHLIAAAGKEDHAA